MSQITIGTVSTGTLNGIVFGGPSTTASDLGSINASMTNDNYFGTATMTAATTQSAFTGTVPSASNTLTGCSSNALLYAQPGFIVLGPGILPGTFVLSLTSAASTITLSQNSSTAATTTGTFWAVPPGAEGQGNLSLGRLQVPNRGVLNVYPNDIVAIDPQTGWPMLISKFAAAATISFTHT